MKAQSPDTVAWHFRVQVHAVLLQLAKQGKLGAQVEAAKETMKRKVDEKKAKGQPIVVDDF